MKYEKKIIIVHHDNNILKEVCSFPSVKLQILKLRFIIPLCFLVSIFILSGIFLVGQITGASLRHLTIDPADVELRPAYIGMLSHFGIMLWAASAAVCFFGANLLRKTSDVGAFRFLLFSGFTCSGLLFDDALLIHDRVMPHTLGIPETIVYIVYLSIMILYLYSFAHKILKTEYFLLFIAGACLGISILMDSIFPITSIETFIEDGMKFTGIVFWFAYFAYTTTSIVSKHGNGEDSVDYYETIKHKDEIPMKKGEEQKEFTWFRKRLLSVTGEQRSKG